MCRQCLCTCLDPTNLRTDVYVNNNNNVSKTVWANTFEIYNIVPMYYMLFNINNHLYNECTK